MAFVVLSAFGIVYITASYLGFIDQILGRGITVEATLPTSGGLYEGGQVSYRGRADRRDLRHDRHRRRRHGRAEARGGHQAPRGLPDVRAQPVGRRRAVPRLRAGQRRRPVRRGRVRARRAARSSLPVDEADLLVELDSFVSSVDKENLQIVVRELGTMFEGTGQPLQNLLDNGSRFVDEAAAHTDETIALLDNGLTVLRTQQGQGENIRSFSRDLRLITDTLRESDGDLRAGARRHTGRGSRADRPARGPRADDPRAARQRDQRRAGGGQPPPRAGAAARRPSRG